jgi:hypothetical protein
MMKEKRQKRVGEVKPDGLKTGLVLIFILACLWLPPCWAMDALTLSEMNDLSGQIGLSIAFRGTSTVEAEFNSLCYGDPDGLALWAGDAGWLVLIGTGSNSGYLRTVIPDDAEMTIDVGTTGGSVCTPGGAGYLGIAIPANTPFFTFTLTKAFIDLAYPPTVNIRLGANPQAGTSNELVGAMQATKLAIEKDPNMTSRCYIWAHP